MWLLDIIADPNHVHRVIPIIKLEEVDTVPSADSILTDSTAVDTVYASINGSGQQLADIAPMPSNFLGLAGDEILWTILVVLAALSLCFYFVKKYRHQHP